MLKNLIYSFELSTTWLLRKNYGNFFSLNRWNTTFPHTASDLNNIQQNLNPFFQGRLTCLLIITVRTIPNFLASSVWQAGAPPSRDGAMPNTDVLKVSRVAANAVCCYITAISFCKIFRVEQPSSPWLARFPVTFSTTWF